MDDEDTTFSPTSGCTRADFVTLLWRYAGKPTVETGNNFTDVPSGVDYEDAVNWAISNDILNGTTTTTFSPSQVCTRGEVVTFLYRFSNISNNYSIRYNLMGGTQTTNKTSYSAGRDSFTLNNPTKQGYTFDGWTGSNYSGYVESGYVPQKTVNITTSDVGNKTYTANWTANNYTVSFNSNGGTGTMEDEYFTYNVPQALLKNTFTKWGYVFKGWNTKSDGTGTSYSNEKTVKNLTSIKDGKIILYAQWSHEEHIEVVDKAVAATCTTTGKTEGKHCSVCNEVLVAQETVPAKGHTEVIDNAVAATCTTAGKTEGKHCSVCNKIIVAQKTVSVLGHNYENGVCTRCSEEEPRVKVTSEKYEIGEEYITKINPKTKVKDLKENLETNAEEIKIYTKENKEIGENELVGTGAKVELKLGNETRTFTLAVKGDVNGDGEVKLSDMTIINRYRLHKRTLEGEYLAAGDVNGDGKVDIKDIVKINRYRLNKIAEL